MELQQVRYFVALCKSLNFTQAARTCQVSQPALTRGIQRLEEELGGELFRRERQLTQLTGLGRLMRPHLEQMLEMAETAIDDASRFNKNELASLRIGFSPAVTANFATESLSEVTRRIPMLEVSLFSSPQDDIVLRLLEGELDVGFLIDKGHFSERLNIWLLHTEDFHLAISPAHPLAQIDPIPLRDLQEQTLIDCADCIGVGTLKQKCQAIGIDVKVPFIVDNYEQAQYIAVSGLGVAILPDCVPLSPALLSRKLADTSLSRAVVMVVVGGRRFSPALNIFVKLTRARDFRSASKN